MSLNVISDHVIVPYELVEVPSHLSKHIFNWSTKIECRRYSFGYILIQEYYSERYSAHHYIYDLTKPIKASFANGSPVMLIYFVLKGTLKSTVTPVNDIVIGEYTYQGLGLPRGTTSIEVDDGVTELFYFCLSELYLKFALTEFTHLNNILQGNGEYLKHKIALPIVPIDYNVSAILHGELFSVANANTFRIKLRKSVYNLLSYYDEQIYVNGTDGSTMAKYEREIEEIKAEIRSNPNREILTITFFSSKHHMSKSTLQRYFKIICGKPFGMYLHEQCMLKAQDLLRDKDSTLYNIALEIGYKDDAYLSTAFKDYFGLTPSDYRKRLSSSGATGSTSLLFYALAFSALTSEWCDLVIQQLY